MQTSTFEAERQAFYDNEQHLKSRIQSLSQARKQPRIPRAPSVVDPESEAEWMEDDDQPSEPTTPLNHPQELSPEAEPAEMTALKLELSTLSTSHASLQSTLQLIQTQLIDLKRVNNQLQEDNESYNILLREKTLSGTFDLMKQVGGISETSSDRDDDDTEGEDSGDMNSLPNSSRSALGTVEERDERVDERVDEALDPGYNQPEDEKEPGVAGEETSDGDHDSIGDSTRSSRKARGGRRRAGSTSQSPGATRGESLAGLPITGPGLDLAAELGRAENNAILEGQTIDDRDKSITNKGAKRGKKDRKVSYASEAGGEPGIPNDVESLRSEVKSLKDANKALSLYASKIIDRIISQEGFEHVLAADYEKQPPTPNSASMKNSSLAPPTKMQRRASMFSRSSAPPVPEPAPIERLTTFSSPPLNSGASSTTTSPAMRTQRRSLSFDWRGFSVFGGGEKKDAPGNSRLTHKSGNSVPGARKLDTQEDDDDRRERERLAATMKLMGIEKPLSPPVIHKSFSSPVEGSSPSLTISPPLASPSLSTPNTSRFSLFRRSSSAANSDGDSSKSAPVNLTEDALAMSEAENTLAALDAQEKAMSAEMAKGASGGFTEIVPRRKSGSRRSRTSGGGSGSGSTVWSAGMSREADDGDD